MLDYRYRTYGLKSILCFFGVCEGAHSQFEIRKTEMFLAGAYLAAGKTKSAKCYSILVSSKQHSFAARPLGMLAHASTRKHQQPI